MNNLKFLRLSLGLSQWELAHQSDMSQGRLSMIERGFFPPTDEELQRIHDMAIKAGILQKPIDMKDLIDRQFIPADIKPANIDVQP